MNTNSKIVLAVMVGVAFGAVANQGLHAQAKLKGSPWSRFTHRGRTD